MSIEIWLGVFGVIAMVALFAFLYFFMKDSRLRMVTGKKGTTLLVDCGLLFLSLISVAAGILLYVNWEEQLNYFLNR